MKVVEFDGERLQLAFGRYANGRTAMRLYMDDGTPYATATTNLPDENIEEDEVIIKNWEENRGVLDALQAAEVVSECVRIIAVNKYVDAHVCRLLISEVDDVC